ncbi:hypothetical protein [Maribellus sediminis]|uniref:hypothetical protein n=1 Tax=Maribellus sediminis TaxID=2696285 RepID=UPI001431420C|nr:hypothetical protein [Maribellus sediminis]
MIEYLKHSQINKQKWDASIENSQNGLVYALSWYLDCVSPNWDALVLNDYEAVMPLTWRRKYGIKYIFVPYFTHRLGVFGSKENIEQYSTAFLESIPKSFKHIHYSFNTHNSLKHNKIKLIPNNLDLLVLNKSYSELQSNYSKNHLKNIRKAEKHNLKIEESIEVKEFCNDYIEIHTALGKFSKYEGIFEVFKPLCDLIDKNIKTYCCRVKNDDETNAVIMLVIFKGRAIFHSAASLKGRENSAQYLLIDHVIRKFSDTGIILDFAGSNIKSISYRNKGFGTSSESFHSVFYFRFLDKILNR